MERETLGHETVVQESEWTMEMFCDCQVALRAHLRSVVINLFIYLFLKFMYLWPRHAARGILVPQPGIEPGAMAVKAPSPNHWTIRELPVVIN